MTHKQIFDLINKWMPQVPLDDAANQLAFAQAAYGQFSRMQPGREDLFHSSYSELTSVMNAVINAWCAKALLKYLPSDSLCFNQCTMLLFTALSDGRRHLFIQPVSSGLPYGISITFPHDFVTFYEGVK